MAGTDDTERQRDLPDAVHAAVDDIGRRAGAALRRPPVGRALDAVRQDGVRRRRARLAGTIAGATAAALAVLSIVVLADDDRDDSPPIISTPSTTVSPSGSDVLEAALLTAGDLGSGWELARVAPKFVFDPASARSMPECDEFAGALFDRFAAATVATRRFTNGDAWVNEYVVVFESIATGKAVWGEINGWGSGAAHKQCFAALRDRASLSPVALDLFGTLVRSMIGGGGSFKYVGVVDGELRTRTKSKIAAANLWSGRAWYMTESSGVDDAGRLAVAAALRVHAAAGRSNP